LSFHFL